MTGREHHHDDQRKPGVDPAECAERARAVGVRGDRPERCKARQGDGDRTQPEGHPALVAQEVGGEQPPAAERQGPHQGHRRAIEGLPLGHSDSGGEEGGCQQQSPEKLHDHPGDGVGDGSSSSGRVHVSATLVPSPGALVTLVRPPTPSCVLRRSTAAHGEASVVCGSNPTPSSVTVALTSLGLAVTVSRASSTPACLPTLSSASSRLRAQGVERARRQLARLDRVTVGLQCHRHAPGRGS